MGISALIVSRTRKNIIMQTPYPMMVFVEEIDVSIEKIFVPDWTCVAERAERMREVFFAPTEPPPIKVVWENGWTLLDGRHRCVAARKLGKRHLRAKVFRWEAN